jgi:hypothetical protein
LEVFECPLRAEATGLLRGRERTLQAIKRHCYLQKLPTWRPEPEIRERLSTPSAELDMAPKIAKEYKYRDYY